MRALGYIELQKPIRSGWYKEIVITHRLEKYKNKAAIREVYNKIEKLFWGRTKEEADRKWRNQTSKYLINREIPSISRRQYNLLSHKARRLCVPFYYMIESRKLKLRYYVKIPKGAYRIKYTRAYITHSKRIDPELVREFALLDKQLLKNGFYEADKRIYGWDDDWRIDVHKREKYKMKQDLRKLKNCKLEEFIKDEISWERN